MGGSYIVYDSSTCILVTLREKRDEGTEGGTRGVVGMLEPHVVSLLEYIEGFASGRNEGEKAALGLDWPFAAAGVCMYVHA